jgi:hypothetical protein
MAEEKSAFRQRIQSRRPRFGAAIAAELVPGIVLGGDPQDVRPVRRTEQRSDNEEAKNQDLNGLDHGFENLPTNGTIPLRDRQCSNFLRSGARLIWVFPTYFENSRRQIESPCKSEKRQPARFLENRVFPINFWPARGIEINSGCFSSALHATEQKPKTQKLKKSMNQHVRCQVHRSPVSLLAFLISFNSN